MKLSKKKQKWDLKAHDNSIGELLIKIDSVPLEMDEIFTTFKAVTILVER